MPRMLSLAYLLHVFRAVRYRVVTLFGKLMLRGLHVSYGKHLTLKGLPIVARCPGSSITLGDYVVLVSYSSDTALGVNHPVKIETVSPQASIVIGDHVGISGGSFCAQVKVEIGAGCLLGANVMIADTDFHPIAAANRRYNGTGVRAAEVVIGQNVFLGSNVTVLKGVYIGRNSVIGAGSLVTKDIPENAIAAGNPCRVLRFLTEEELKDEALPLWRPWD